jgi:positive regulator of sigma E activity
MSATGCCGCGTFGQARQIPVAWLEAAAEPRTGDWLTVEVSVAALTRAAVWVFAVPLAALLAGAWLGAKAAGAFGLGPDIVSGAVGLGCLALASAFVSCHGGAVVGTLKLRSRHQRMDS